VLYGKQPWLNDLSASLRKVRRLGWQPDSIEPLEAIDALEEQTSQRPLAIVAAGDEAVDQNYYRLLNKVYRKVVLVRESDQLGSFCVEPRDIDGRLGLEFRFNLLRPEANLVKWLIDRLGALLLLVLLSPLLLIIALLIKLDSRGPVFFRQERIGRNFCIFNVLKFRTMVADAEGQLGQVLAGDPQAKAQYEKFHKLTLDPRVTGVGRVLRKFSLDELPQLWNVLTGSMSLVGPRAYMVSEQADMGAYAPIILRARPGMSGWWQIMERHEAPFARRLQMDEFYISNWSLWLDIYIILRTALVVFKGQGK
jgi:Undecaprenyl-phosphate galactose phosphotransferase WbaP